MWRGSLHLIFWFSSYLLKQFSINSTNNIIIINAHKIPNNLPTNQWKCTFVKIINLMNNIMRVLLKVGLRVFINISWNLTTIIRIFNNSVIINHDNLMWLSNPIQHFKSNFKTATKYTLPIVSLIDCIFRIKPT